MRRLHVLLVAALAAGALFAVSQAAKGKPEHEMNVTVLAAQVKSLSGDRAIFAGYSKGNPFGKSATIIRGVMEDPYILVAFKFTVYGRHGTATGTADLKTDDGGKTYTGSGDFKRGTGAYDDISDHLNITGTYNSGTGVLTLHATRGVGG